MPVLTRRRLRRPEGRRASRYHAAVVRALLFDFNGVLVDDEPLHGELFARVLAEEGVELPPRDYAERYFGLDDRAGFLSALAAAASPASEERIARLVARKAAYYQLAIRRGGYPFFPGAAELVRAAAAGLTLAVVSGALRAEVEGGLRQEGLLSCFKRLITAEDVRRGKPDPEGYATALAALNSDPPLPARLIHPHEVAAIEDSPAGLEAAAACGLRTVAVGHSYPAAALALADVVVPRLADLGLAELLRRLGG